MSKGRTPDSPAASLRRVRERLWPLAIYQLAVFAVSSVLLAPALSLVFRLFVSSTGKNVLSDTEIISFFLGWKGIVPLLVLGILTALVNAVTMIGFLAILHRAPPRTPSSKILRHVRGVARTLATVARNAPALALQFAVVVSTLVLVFIPALAVLAILVRPMIAEYDINYYLSALPADFLVAVATAMVPLLLSSGAALYLMIHWSLAVPLLLFDRAGPWRSLVDSHRLVAARRRAFIARLGLWALAWLCALALADAAMERLGEIAVSAVSDLTATLVVTGIVVLVSLGVGLTLSFLGLAVLADILLGFHAAASGRSRAEPAAPSRPRPTVDAHADGSPTARSLLVAIPVLVGSAVAVSWILLRDIDLDYQPRIIAHRGNSTEAPENTLAAIDLAYRQGADLVEIDVQLGADGSVLVIHDNDLKRVADNELKVGEATREALAGIDVGSWFDRRFVGETVPTLEQVLARVPESAALLVELKHDHGNGNLEQRVLETVATAGAAERVEYMSLKYRRIRRLAALDPDPAAGFVSNVAVGDLTDSDADFYAVSARAATRDFVRRAHGAGKRVYVWTVNTPREMALFIDRGVDGIITDNPALLGRVIDELDEFTAAERLLLRVSHDTGLKLGDTPQ